MTPSSKGSTLLKIVGAGTAVCAVGALLYYVFREQPVVRTQRTDDDKERKPGTEHLNLEEVPKERVIEILKDIIASQKRMKTAMQEISSELKKSNVSLEEAYYKVTLKQPQDPIESHGMTMSDFDSLLEKFSTDIAVRDLIATIMGNDTPLNVSSEAQALSASNAKIIEIHSFMLDELKRVVNEFEDLRKSGKSFDTRTMTIAAQAIVGARVETKYNVASDDIEAAVLLNHQSLTVDPEFARINMQMQATLSTLIGSQFSL